MMQQETADPFASVRLNQKPTMQQPPEKEENQEDPFSQARIKKSQDLPETYEIGRHAARIGSRIAEVIGGIPGDVENLVKSGLIFPIKKLVSEEGFKKIQEGGVFKRHLPTSQELQKFSEESSKGLTKAQSPAEEMGDEAAKTVASLLGPMKFRRALGIGIGSQLTKEGMKIAGFGEGPQEAGKLGTMFLMSLYNPKGALNYSKEQYDVANNLAKGASINAHVFEGNLLNLQKDLQKGFTTSTKNSVLNPIDDLLGKFKKGKILVQDLTAAKRDINSVMGDPDTLTGAKKLLKVLGKDIDRAIKPFEKLNPAFAKAYRPANEIYGAVMQGNKTSNFIRKTLGTKLLGGVLAEAALGHPEAILPTIGISAAGYGAIKAGEFLTRVMRSPELQKFYAKALAAAAVEDAAALRLYNDKIEEHMKKD